MITPSSSTALYPGESEIQEWSGWRHVSGLVAELLSAPLSWSKPKTLLQDDPWVQRLRFSSPVTSREANAVPTHDLSRTARYLLQLGLQVPNCPDTEYAIHHNPRWKNTSCLPL